MIFLEAVTLYHFIQLWNIDEKQARFLNQKFKYHHKLAQVIILNTFKRHFLTVLIRICDRNIKKDGSGFPRSASLCIFLEHDFSEYCSLPDRRLLYGELRELIFKLYGSRHTEMIRCYRHQNITHSIPEISLGTADLSNAIYIYRNVKTILAKINRLFPVESSDRACADSQIDFYERNVSKLKQELLSGYT